MIRHFEQALESYYERRFEQARDAFYNIVLEAGDKTSKIFAERCENYLIELPPEDWDGVYIAKEK